MLPTNPTGIVHLRIIPLMITLLVNHRITSTTNKSYPTLRPRPFYRHLFPSPLPQKSQLRDDLLERKLQFHPLLRRHFFEYQCVSFSGSGSGAIPSFSAWCCSVSIGSRSSVRRSCLATTVALSSVRIGCFLSRAMTSLSLDLPSALLTRWLSRRCSRVAMLSSRSVMGTPFCFVNLV